MMANRSSIHVIDDIPSFKEIYQCMRINGRRRVVKIDRTETAAEAMPTFQRAVHCFCEGGPKVMECFGGADADDVLAITMMSVGIVVRRQDGKRATNRNVDIIWFPHLPRTTFFANEDVVAYVGDWPDILRRAPEI